jgi:hypothetical protein
MKTTTLTEENNNLVLFPSAKNFPLQEDLQDLQDPLHDLLNEYSHMGDEDIPAYLDDRFSGDSLETDTLGEDGAFSSLEAFMGRHQEQTASPDDKLISLINERLEAIQEAKERIKFYLNEIEMFHPKRR